MCPTIPSLLCEIDRKIAEMGVSLYNNVVFMLNNPVNGETFSDLLNYRRILTYKYENEDYAGAKFSIKHITSKVKLLINK